MTDLKTQKILDRLKKVISKELEDDYTGKFELKLNLQTGGISGKVQITKEV